MVRHSRHIVHALLALGLAMASLTPAVADPQQDYEAGVAAFDRSDLMTSMQLLRKAADAGHAAAQAQYAYILDKAEENEAARRYYRMSAEQDNIEGILGLAALYQIGEGGVVDLVAAAQWLRRGVELGSDKARRRLNALEP